MNSFNKERNACFGVAFLLMFMIGIYFVHIPWNIDRLNITESQLGFGVKAYVGINRDPKFKTEIHENLLKIPEIDRIIEVTGRFDLMVGALAEDLEQLHNIVVDKIGKIDGIQNTETFVELERTEKSPMYLSN